MFKKKDCSISNNKGGGVVVLILSHAWNFFLIYTAHVTTIEVLIILCFPEAAGQASERDISDRLMKMKGMDPARANSKPVCVILLCMLGFVQYITMFNESKILT